MSQYTAASLYGGPPPPVATATPVPDHAPGTPEPTHAVPAGSGLGVLANPTAALIVLVALAVLLVQVSVRVQIDA